MLTKQLQHISSSSRVEKGHFMVYNTDEKRFMLPLEYLKKEIVMELFKLAKEEFGLSSNGYLTLPFDATCMEYVIGLIKRKASREVRRALLMSIVSGRCSSSPYLYQQDHCMFEIYNEKKAPDFVSWLMAIILLSSL
ncbi:hypothetical protein PTKIN_Ptkin02bG0145800 [Pterospermum kingtungense]